MSCVRGGLSPSPRTYAFSRTRVCGVRHSVAAIGDFPELECCGRTRPRHRSRLRNFRFLGAFSWFHEGGGLDGEESKEAIVARWQTGSRPRRRRTSLRGRYTAKKTRKSAGAVKKAVKKVGSSRKRVVKALKGKKR
jgi:hypothetical protein